MAITQDHAHRSLVAQATLHYFINCPYPRREQPLSFWTNRFEIMGPFWADLHVDHHLADGDGETADGTFRQITRLKFDPPPKLFRAASARGNTGLVWTPSYELAQRVANSRGAGVDVWSASPKTIYGCIDAHRDYYSHGKSTGLSDDFTLWLIEPNAPQLEDRWLSPTEPGVQLPKWADRDVTEGEVKAIVNAWATHNPTDHSAVDLFDMDYWRAKLKQTGQFSAVIEKDGAIKVAPTRTLKPTTTLYRAATDEYAHSLAWTTEWHAVQKYLRWRGPQARIWTAEAAEVYGRVYWPGTEMGAPYWEWLIEPVNVRPLGDD